MAKKNSLDKTYITIALILGLAILGYALIGRQTKLDTIREQEQTEREQINAEREAISKQEERETERKRNLRLCLSIAESERWSSWQLNCESFGSNIKRDENDEIESCNLSMDLANDIDEQGQKEKDRCSELYK